MKWLFGLGKESDQPFPDNGETFFGLENYGNTCYCNSVLQALYSCRPFRQRILEPPKVVPTVSSSCSPLPFSESAASSASTLGPEELSELKKSFHPLPPASASASTAAPPAPSLSPLAKTRRIFGSYSPTSSGSNMIFEHSRSNSINSTSTSSSRSSPHDGQPGEHSLLLALRSLFSQMSSQKKRSGWLSPKAFITQLRLSNELFRNLNQQDAHEFFNFIINDLSDSVLKLEKKASSETSWIQDLFQGMLSNETRCLVCENITRRKEAFIDLSIDISQNKSLTSALGKFSECELLNDGNKFYCDTCHCLQEAEKRMKIFSAPPILVLHLKRFKYVEKLSRFLKLNCRVPFPTELRLLNMAEDALQVDPLYGLFAVVVHIGSGPNQGHYVAVVKTGHQWIVFDDDLVEVVDDAYIQSIFGSRGGTMTGNPLVGPASLAIETGYLLFYQAAEFEPKIETDSSKAFHVEIVGESCC